MLLSASQGPVWCGDVARSERAACVRAPACSGRVYFYLICSPSVLQDVLLLRSQGSAAKAACECWAFTKTHEGKHTWLSLSPLSQAVLRGEAQPPPEQRLQPVAAPSTAASGAAQAQSPKSAAVRSYHEAVVQRLLGKAPSGCVAALLLT